MSSNWAQIPKWKKTPSIEGSSFSLCNSTLQILSPSHTAICPSPIIFSPQTNKLGLLGFLLHLSGNCLLTHQLLPAHPIKFSKWPSCPCYFYLKGEGADTTASMVDWEHSLDKVMAHFSNDEQDKSILKITFRIKYSKHIF